MQKVYVEKFGGASVNTSSAVKNVLSILGSEKRKRIVVVSAMGKTTNALEKVVNLWHNERRVDEKDFEALLSYHFEIIDGLFKKENDRMACRSLVALMLEECRAKILTLNPNDYDFLYDSIVSYGERVSTSIISSYMSAEGFSHRHISAPDFIKTNNNFRTSDLKWKQTETLIKQNLLPLFDVCDTGCGRITEIRVVGSKNILYLREGLLVAFRLNDIRN